MHAITATEFVKKFGYYNMEAQREPVAVTSHGRVSGYYISAREYEALQQARARQRQAYTLENMPEELVQAITSSKVDTAYNHLNDLLEDNK